MLDSNENPLPGKYITAFTWSEFSFSESTNDYYMDPIKLGLLENSISVSDQEGIATFHNLKLVGSSAS